MKKKKQGLPQINKIPKQLRPLLAERGISEEEIILTSKIDMDLSCHFTRGCLLITKEKLLVAVSEAVPGELHYFKGTENISRFRIEAEREWELDVYEIKDIQKLLIERTVGGGFLIMIAPDPVDEKAEGEATSIAAFSNKCMGDVNRLEKIFKNLQEEKEITPEMLEDKEMEAYCPNCGNMYPDPERKICPKCMDTKNIFFRTLGYLKPHKKKLAVMFLCYICTAVLNLVWPYLNGTILYDKVLGKSEDFLAKFGIADGRYAVALGLVVLTMIMTRLTIQLVGILQGVLTAKIVPELVRDMKTEVFTSMGKLSINFFTSKQTGSLMTRVMYDADEVTGFFIDGLPYFLINVFTIIAMAVIMFTLHPILAVAAMIFMPVTFLISWILLPRLWHRYGKQHRANRSLNSRIHDNLTGARVVKAFGQEESEIERFNKNNERVRNADMEVVAYDNKFWGLYSAAENLAGLLVMVVGAYLIIVKKDIDLGLMITFTGYVSQLNGPMDFFSHFFRWFTGCMNCAQRMFEIIDAVPEIQEIADPIHLEHIDGTIEMKNVTFGYEQNKPVLKNVTMKAEAGKMLGIVGRSGAGKTTIVNLISRLYDPQEGTVTLDGVNLKDLSFETLRGNVAMVSQETYIFMGTVAENIAYAKKDATKEEIIRAAVLASAHDFICKMPDGYDTQIGSSGRELSGGERQRISIARAILANPKILILDETTASVDTETEQAIQVSINLLIKGRTTISIAHRLSTLRDAHRLVVIDDGKVTEEGTHEELVAKKGTYFKLRELQTKALALKGLE